MEARAQESGVDTNCRIARRPSPCRGFHQIRTSVQLKHRPPNERRASSIPLSATADSTRSIDLGPRPVWRPIYYHRGRDAGCRSFSRTNPRHAEAFAAGIDRGTQCAGDQHQNLFASLSSFLDDPASFILSGQSGVRVVTALFSQSLFFSPSPTSLPCIRTI